MISPFLSILIVFTGLMSYFGLCYSQQTKLLLFNVQLWMTCIKDFWLCFSSLFLVHLMYDCVVFLVNSELSASVLQLMNLNMSAATLATVNNANFTAPKDCSFSFSPLPNYYKFKEI